MIRKLKSFYFVWSQYMVPGQPGWHLDIIEEADMSNPSQFMADFIALGNQTSRERQLNMAQMEDMGYSLAAIANDINEDVMSQLQAAQARILELEGMQQMRGGGEGVALGGDSQEL